MATKTSTEGEFDLYRVDMSPHAGGPKTHFHETVSESFYILVGTVGLFNGSDDWVDAEKGDFLYVRKAACTPSSTIPTHRPKC